MRGKVVFAALLSFVAFFGGAPAHAAESSEGDALGALLVDFDGDGKVSAEETFLREVWAKDDGLLNLLLTAAENSEPPAAGIVDISKYLELRSAAVSAAARVIEPDYALPSCASTWVCCFIRGDANGDGIVNVNDLNIVAGIANWSESTATQVANLDSCDVDDNGRLESADVTYLSAYLYTSGPEPLAPFPNRGTDPSQDLIMSPCADQHDKESAMNPLDGAEIALPPVETPGFPRDLLPEKPFEPIDGTGGLGALGPDLPVFPGPGGLAWGCRPSYKTRHTVRENEAASADLDMEQGVNWFSGIPHISVAEDGAYWVRWSANCVREYFETATNTYEGKYTNMTKLVYDPTNNEFLLYDLGGRVYVFFGYASGTVGQSSTIPRTLKGRIKRIEGIGGTVSGSSTIKPRVQFTWDYWTGELVQVEVISSDDEAHPCQTWIYAFDAAMRRIEQVTLQRPNGREPLLIAFRYWGDGEEGGTSGDLMQIDVSTDLSPTSLTNPPDTITRSYYYRYFVDSWADQDGQRGYLHQVRFFYGPDACKELETATYQGLEVPGQADRTYQYCADRRPKSLSIRGGCGSCGGGGQGDYTYSWYLGKTVATAGINESHVKAAITLANPNPEVESLRQLLVFDAFGQKLIDATCVDESGSAEKSWVWAGVYGTTTNDEWCLRHKYWPSACESFDPDAGAAHDCETCGESPGFSGNGALGGNYTPATGAGKHQEYSFAWSSPYFWLGSQLGQGTAATTPVKMLRLQLFTVGNRMRWVPSQISEYKDASTHFDTTYTYSTFHAEDALAFKDVSVAHPVVSTGNNGPGGTTGVTEYTWYNKFGVPVWTKDGRSRIGYMEYDMVYSVTTGNAVTWLEKARVDDINTNSPPAGVMPGVPPSGFATIAADPVNDLTMRGFDALCRPVYLMEHWGPCRYFVYARLAGPTDRLSPDKAIEIAYPHVSNGVPFGEVTITGTTPGGKQCLSAKAFLPGGGTDFFYTNDWVWQSPPSEINDVFSSETRRLLERREVEYTYSGTDGHRIVTERSWPEPYQPLSYYVQHFEKYTRTTHYNSEGLPARIEGCLVETSEIPNGFRQVEWRTYDPLGRPSTVAMGSSDADKVTVAHHYYDGGENTSTLAVGDGNLTLLVKYLGDAAVGTNESAMTARKTKHVYNWRGFRTETWEGYDSTSQTALAVNRFTLDNQGRQTLVERFQTDTTATNLRGKTATAYDERGRTCLQTVYGVDQLNGNVQTATLKTLTWYDAVGNVMKLKQPDGTFRKLAYDGLNRVTAEYLAFDTAEADTNYGAAQTLASDTVVEQTEKGYDYLGNLIKVVTYKRWHDGTGAGALTTSNARREYRWLWHDPLGRVDTDAFYGTNGGSAMSTRPATKPTATDGTVQVTSYAYASGVSGTSRWQTRKAVDGRIEGSLADALGRTVRQWVRKSATETDHKVTDFTHDALGHVITETVYQQTLSSPATPPTDPVGGGCTTAYDWGVLRAYTNGDWSENHVTSTELLRQVRRPDSATGDPRVPPLQPPPDEVWAYKVAYNALGEARAVWSRKSDTATVGVRALYDAMGREISEVVRYGYDEGYVVGSKGLAWDYDALRRITSARSLDASLAVANEVTYAFGPYGEVTEARQEHNGAVSMFSTAYASATYGGPGSSYGLRRPTVQYFVRQYGSGTANEAQIAYDYGSAGAIDDMLTRPVKQTYFRYPEATKNKFRVEEKYLGVGTPVRSQFFWESSPTSPKMTAEISDYKLMDSSSGLDRFGRTAKFKAWKDASTWALRRTWTYEAATARLTGKNDYKKDTNQPEFTLAAWVHAYDGFARLRDVDYDYRQYAEPGWSWVDETDDDAHWLYDGADGITHFSGDGIPTPPSRTLNRRGEIAAIGTSEACIQYTEIGQVKYENHAPVTDKDFFFDAWGRMCGHGPAADPPDPPDPADRVVIDTYDALGRVIVRTDYGATPSTVHYYYDLQGNRAWEGTDVQTVTRVHFHSWYSGRNFALIPNGDGTGALMASGGETALTAMAPLALPPPTVTVYYVVDPGDGAAALCKYDGSFRQSLSPLPTGEPHSVTKYEENAVVGALLPGGDTWDQDAKLVGGYGGEWHSVVLGDLISYGSGLGGMGARLTSVDGSSRRTGALDYVRRAWKKIKDWCYCRLWGSYSGVAFGSDWFEINRARQMARREAMLQCEKSNTACAGWCYKNRDGTERTCQRILEGFEAFRSFETIGFGEVKLRFTCGCDCDRPNRDGWARTPGPYRGDPRGR